MSDMQTLHANDLKKENLEIRKRIFNGLCVLLLAGASVWTLTCMVQEEFAYALVPAVFVIITLINRRMARRASKVERHALLQFLLSVTLPFLFQMALEGLGPSGMIMLWSFVPLVAAVGYYRRQRSMIWLLSITSVIILFILFDPAWHNGIVLQHGGAMHRPLLALNLSCVALVMFGMALGFVRFQGKSYKKMFQLQCQLQLANELVADRNDHLEKSMNYARRIQQALLPNELDVPDIFNELFILIKQREKVGGDSLWHAEKGDVLVLALIDCTGHGVPGSMLTIMVHEILTSGFNHQNVNSPAALVTFLFKRLAERMKTHDDLWNDNAEVAIIELDRKTGKVRFSGTAMSLLVLTDQGVRRIKGQGTIFSMEKAMEREQHNLEVALDPSGSNLYLYSDGVVDQFNEAGNRRFTSGRFLQLVKELGHLPMQDQEELFSEALAAWQGTGQHTDDMSLIGLELCAAFMRKNSSAAKLHSAA